MEGGAVIPVPFLWWYTTPVVGSNTLWKWQNQIRMWVQLAPHGTHHHRLPSMKMPPTPPHWSNTHHRLISNCGRLFWYRCSCLYTSVDPFDMCDCWCCVCMFQFVSMCCVYVSVCFVCSVSCVFWFVCACFPRIQDTGSNILGPGSFLPRSWIVDSVSRI